MAQRFDAAALRDLAGYAVVRPGEDYVRAGRVELLSDDGDCLRARIAGTEVNRATLRGGGGRFTGECSYPAFTDHGFCKRLVAAATAIPWSICLRHSPERKRHARLIANS